MKDYYWIRNICFELNNDFEEKAAQETRLVIDNPAQIEQILNGNLSVGETRILEIDRSLLNGDIKKFAEKFIYLAHLYIKDSKHDSDRNIVFESFIPDCPFLKQIDFIHPENARKIDSVQTAYIKELRNLYERSGKSQSRRWQHPDVLVIDSTEALQRILADETQPKIRILDASNKDLKVTDGDITELAKKFSNLRGAYISTDEVDVNKAVRAFIDGSSTLQTIVFHNYESAIQHKFDEGGLNAIRQVVQRNIEARGKNKITTEIMDTVIERVFDHISAKLEAMKFAQEK